MEDVFSYPVSIFIFVFVIFLFRYMIKKNRKHNLRMELSITKK